MSVPDTTLLSQGGQRLAWIDVCRGIGILIVLLGHSGVPDLFIKFIYGFHMPFFFLLSGYLYHQRTSFREYCKRNVERYLFPYAVLCAINFLIQNQNIIEVIKENGESDWKTYIIGILYSRGTVEWMPNCSPLWFLTAQFVALIYFFFIEKVKNAKIQFLVVCICTLLGYGMYRVDVPKLIWNIDTALMAVFFMWSGEMLKEKDWLKRIDKHKHKKSIVFIILAVSLCGIGLNDIDVVSFDNCTYGNLFLMLAGALSMCVLIMLTVWRMCKNHSFPFLEFLGKHTIFVMGFDYFCVTITRVILSRIGIRNWFAMFCGKVIILMVGLFCWIKLVQLIPNRKLQKILGF